jgi:hypothetical protein
MLINVDPAILAGAATSESGGAATKAAAATAAAATTSAVIPPGADDVSVRAAAALVARSAATTGILAEYIAMREMFAGAVGSSGATYTAVEAINTAAATIGGA